MANIDYEPYQGKVSESGSYLEFKPNELLRDYIQTYWRLTVPTGPFQYRSVPDNCVDLIINLNDPQEMFIVSPFSQVKVFEMQGPVVYFGIRFRPLGHQGIIALPLGAWQSADGVINASEVLSKNLLSALRLNADKTQTFTERCLSISTLLLDDWQPRKADARLMRYIDHCHQSLVNGANLSEKQCTEFGLSARQLRRLSAQQLGLSPRDFTKVLRFQYVLKSMQSESNMNVWVNSYYDQPHFIRNFKSMSGVTPNRFYNLSVLYNTK